MNDADRIVSQRLAARAAQAGPSGETLRHRAERAHRQEQWEAIVAWSQYALAALERRGWPGGRMVLLERQKGWFGGFERYKKAGWTVCPHRYLWKNEVQIDAVIYLLSDGRLARDSHNAPASILNDRVEHIVGSDNLDRISGRGVWDIPFDAILAGLERISTK